MSGRLCYGHTAHIIDAGKLKCSFCYACKGDWKDGQRYIYMIDRVTRRGFAIHDLPLCEGLLAEKLNRTTNTEESDGTIHPISSRGTRRRRVVPVPSLGCVAQRDAAALHA